MLSVEKIGGTSMTRFKDILHSIMLRDGKPIIVCVMGSNISQPGVLAKAASALSENGINIDCVTQSLRQVTMQLIIERRDYTKAISNLHAALCEP